MSDTVLKMLIFFSGSSLVGWMIFFAGIGAKRSRRKREALELTRAEGTVVDYARKETRGRGGPYVSWRPVVEYSVYEQRYHLEYENGMDPEQYPVGSTVEVLYNPDRPSEFHLAEDAVYRNGGGNAVRIGLTWILLCAVGTVALAVFVGGWNPDFRRLGRDAGRILSGGKPASTPVTGTSDVFEYEVKSKTGAVITGYNGADETLVIPSFLDGHIITGFSGTPFIRAMFLKDLTVPGTVGSIPMLCFSACRSLSKLTLREGVRSLGSRAFYSSTSLAEVTLPASLASIADDAFPEGCTAVFHVPAGSHAEAWCRKKGFETAVP